LVGLICTQTSLDNSLGKGLSQSYTHIYARNPYPPPFPYPTYCTHRLNLNQHVMVPAAAGGVMLPVHTHADLPGDGIRPVRLGFRLPLWQFSCRKPMIKIAKKGKWESWQ
jgi:hypothetical protein